MKTFFGLGLILAFAIFQVVQSQPRAGSKQFKLPDYETYYKWKKVEFVYPNEAVRVEQEAKADQSKIFISAPKIYKDRMFLSTPRFKNGGVPVTFSEVPYNRNDVDVALLPAPSPKLTPYPSFAMQEEKNCTAFQLVESMEIDQYGRLYVVDVGRTNLLAPTPNNNCPAKLVVFQLGKTAKEDKMLYSYTFPADVAGPTKNALKDITVACKTKDDCWVYISNFFEFNIAVYDVKNNQSWTAAHPSMAPDKAQQTYYIGDTKVEAPFGVVGQGLSPRNTGFNKLYYTSLGRTHLYVVNTSSLQNPALKQNNSLPDSAVLDLGAKESQSDGMTMSNRGTLFYGALTESAVYRTEVNGQTTKLGKTKKIAQSDTELLWPDTFAFDGVRHLAMTSTTFEKYADGTLDLNTYNYRVVRFPVDMGTKAYSA